MDAILRCNDLKCRTLLNDSAVVTTCSHIFCVPCAERLELASPPDGQRKCPACGTYLMNLDDAVVAVLNPTEDYKTSILSGLSPTVVMECAGRGLAFWAYQMAQEITYQDYLSRSIRTKFQDLNTQLDSVVREAHDQQHRLQAKNEALQTEHAALLERIQTMENAARQKQRAHKQQLNLYEKLKRQHMAAGMELAAEHTVDHMLQQDPATDYARPSQQPGIPRRSGSTGSGLSNERRRITLRQDGIYEERRHVPQGSRAGLISSQSAPRVSQNLHRQQLPQHRPQPLFGDYNSSFNVASSAGVGAFQKGTPIHGGNHHGRQNVSPNSAGIGLSANMRSSRPQEYPQGGYAGHSTSGVAGGARMSVFQPGPMR